MKHLMHGFWFDGGQSPPINKIHRLTVTVTVAQQQILVNYMQPFLWHSFLIATVNIRLLMIVLNNINNPIPSKKYQKKKKI